MNNVKCADCSAPLSNPELRDGWCNSCGKRVPLFVYHQAGLNGPGEKAPARQRAPFVADAMDPDERPPMLQLALIGLVVVVIAVVIAWAMIEF